MAQIEFGICGPSGYGPKGIRAGPILMGIGSALFILAFSGLKRALRRPNGA